MIAIAQGREEGAQEDGSLAVLLSYLYLYLYQRNNVNKQSQCERGQISNIQVINLALKSSFFAIKPLLTMDLVAAESQVTHLH